jgi:CTP synthase
MSHGIMPDYLIVRGSEHIDSRRRYLLARFSDLDTDHTIAAADVDNIYKLPLVFYDQKFDQTVIKDLNLPFKPLKKIDLKNKLAFLDEKPTSTVTVTIAGKYFRTGENMLIDSYFALIEAIKHASWKSNIKVKFNYVNTEVMKKKEQKTGRI